MSENDIDFYNTHRSLELCRSQKDHVAGKFGSERVCMRMTGHRMQPDVTCMLVFRPNGKSLLQTEIILS